MRREPIYQALLGELLRLNAPPYDLEIAEISRDFKHWADAAAQPAVYLVEETETGESRRGLPLKWSPRCTIWVYAKKDGATLGIQKVNDILDAIEEILGPASRAAPPNNFSNTLGGLVDRCSIEGPIEKSGGYLGDQAVAVMPIEIILA